jgi:osmoprotectant transport system permease protein
MTGVRQVGSVVAMALIGAAGLFGSWISSNEGMILSLLWQHIQLTAIAVAVGSAISLPLGVAAWRVHALRAPLVGVTGALYVVPSVALLLLVAPITGFFSITTAEVALVSYTLLILLRNTIAGLDSVPADVHDAARGMGYSPLGELVKVQLPLALPSIFAGLRVATVTVVGLVNVTAFIGQGGLGQLIIQGFQEDFDTEIVVGLVLSVLLAGIADALLVGVEKLSLPWLRTSHAVT